jgi:predicted Zn finger-like uncharacterized protein
MILSCPSCSSRFLVDPRAIGPMGRQVRCGKCKHEWQATAPLITMAADVQPIPRKVRPIPPGSSLPVLTKNDGSVPPWRSAAFGIVAALLVMMPLFTLKLGPYFANPNSFKIEKRVMQAIALEGQPVTRLRQEEGRPVLDIEGAIINRSPKLAKVPTLKASALNARGVVVREWTIPLTAIQLEAGQKLPFSFSTPLPDQGVEDVAFHLL